MAQLNNAAQVAKYFESTKAKRFKIFTSVRENLTGVAPLFEYKGSSANDSKNKLIEILELLEEGGDGKTDYSLHCFSSDEDDTDKRKQVITFRVGAGSNIGAAPAAADSGAMLTLLKEMHAEQMAAIKEENKELKYKLELMDSEDDEDEIGAPQTPIEKMIAGITPFIPMLIEKFVFPAAPAAPVSGASVNGIPDNGTLIGVVAELQKHDPKLLQHLQILLRVAENNPDQFKMFIGYLEAM